MFGILAFGDSIVFGRGDNLGWVGRFTKDFQSKDYYNGVYNLGIPGDTSSDLLKRFEVECKARINVKRKEDKFVIIIGIGINDSILLNGKKVTSERKFNRNIKKLVKIANKYSDKVVFVGLTPVDEKLTKPYEDSVITNNRIKKYNEIIRDRCENFIDINLGDNYSKLLSDGLHPNSKGYTLMYKTIEKYLKKNKII